jgi:hypothetical protein
VKAKVLYMLGNDEIQHFSFHLFNVWGSFDNQNFYKLLTITVLGSADSNRKERVMQPQNRPVDVYLNQFITIQFNGASLRNCVKQKIEFPLPARLQHFLREGPYRARD